MKDFDVFHFVKIFKQRKMESVKLSKHSLKRHFERNYDLDMLSKDFNENIPVRILKQNYNKFKVLFTYTKKEDMAVIIGLKTMRI